jgi:hypothetical protein
MLPNRAWNISMFRGPHFTLPGGTANFPHQTALACSRRLIPFSLLKSAFSHLQKPETGMRDIFDAQDTEIGLENGVGTALWNFFSFSGGTIATRNRYLDCGAFIMNNGDLEGKVGLRRRWHYHYQLR